MRRYRMPWQMHRPFATVMTDFGCPFGCSFCNSRSFGYALRDIDDIMAELEHIHKMGVKQLFIKDMSFASSKPHAKRLLEKNDRSAVDFKWNCIAAPMLSTTRSPR